MTQMIRVDIEQGETLIYENLPGGILVPQKYYEAAVVKVTVTGGATYYATAFCWGPGRPSGFQRGNMAIGKAWRQAPNMAIGEMLRKVTQKIDRGYVRPPNQGPGNQGSGISQGIAPPRLHAKAVEAFTLENEYVPVRRGSLRAIGPRDPVAKIELDATTIMGTSDPMDILTALVQLRADFAKVRDMYSRAESAMEMAEARARSLLAN